jgi:hypothetical protein
MGNSVSIGRDKNYDVCRGHGNRNQRTGQIGRAAQRVTGSTGKISRQSRISQPEGYATTVTAAVWLGTPESSTFFNVNTLSDADRLRYDDLRGGRRREEFAVSRALRAEALRGQPGVSSLSHSGGWAAVAHTSDGSQVGVDIEKYRTRDVLGLARFAFDVQEIAALETLAGAARERMFYALWTMKESMAKALGVPLLAATRQCVFTLSDKGWRGTAPTEENWAVSSYQVREDMMLSVVFIGRQPPQHLETIEWPPRRPAAWHPIAEIRAQGT